MKKCLLFLIALCVSSGSAPGQGNGLARNVIIFVSDGCGYKHIEAANLYLHGETGMQVYQQFPVAAGMSTGAGDVTWAHEPLQNNGADNLPGMQYNSGSHTNSLIPFYAKGAGSQAFAEFAAGTDPHRGSYIDNTTVGRLALAAMKKELIVPGDTDRDCKVDMLDMIFILNRLNADPATDDNWQADTNTDGDINILDMIVVRNALSTSCED